MTILEICRQKCDKFQTFKFFIVLCIIPGQSPSSQYFLLVSLTPSASVSQVSPPGHTRVFIASPGPHDVEHAPILHSPQCA